MDVGRKAGLLRYLGNYKIKHEHNGNLPVEQRDETFTRLRAAYNTISQQDIASVNVYVGEILSSLKVNGVVS
jgi:hypothetical protein